MPVHRRSLLKHTLAATALAALPGTGRAQSAARLIENTITSSGEAIPAVGLGSWITFNVGDDPHLLDSCAAVMEAFFDAGGKMIDSSPMYGSAQDTIGYGLDKLDRSSSVFSADKVWTRSPEDGRGQIAQTQGKWGVPRFDLVQIHNLLAWRDHLETLQALKEQGDIRYLGITTSHGRRHGEFEEIMANHPLDFVQLTYNPIDREAEERLLPLARERGIAVIVNRPFQRGSLTDRLAGEPLPQWAEEIGARSWAQIILKFIISHPAVTCAIPATSRVDHVRENMAAASEPLPEEEMRARIVEAIRNS